MVGIWIGRPCTSDPIDRGYPWRLGPGARCRKVPVAEPNPCPYHGIWLQHAPSRIHQDKSAVKENAGRHTGSTGGGRVRGMECGTRTIQGREPAAPPPAQRLGSPTHLFFLVPQMGFVSLGPPVHMIEWMGMMSIKNRSQAGVCLCIGVCGGMRTLPPLVTQGRPTKRALTCAE